MGDTKEGKVFGQYTAEDDAKFEAAAARIISDDPKPPVEKFDLGEPEPQEAPEAHLEESESEVDQDALEEAREAYRRDRLSDDEVEARLQKLGYKQFVQRGQKRAKKHREDDEAYAELRRLRATEDSSKGTKPGDKGERSQAGTPALNLQEVAAPLAERLGLDEEGKKALVASLDAAVRARDGEIMTLKQQNELVVSVLTDTLLDGVRDDVGLGKIDDDDWFRVRQTYEDLIGTRLHNDLTGKPRMKALLKSAAKFLGVTIADQAEIQRQASVAKAKRNGAPVVHGARKIPAKPMTYNEIQDHMGALITSGKFKGQPLSVVREYADKLRANGK